MIVIPPLTPEILAELHAGLPSCGFDDQHQRDFLTSAVSCDVQAAPGNGKTTLIVAKLALLSREWRSRTQGVCVISHTNAARHEVEKKLASHPAASAFLSYPHFIGTVTAFLDRFLALPYLRGFGWPLQRIDDDVFAAMAVSRYSGKPTLRGSAMAQNGARRHQVETWVSNIELSPNFVADVGACPTRLQVRQMPNQPGTNTNSGRELEELKAEMTNSGFFRFGDMTALAAQALQKYPALLQRVRARFPLVLLDEAQDTSGAQLALLNDLFADGVAYQRMGDQNQTLYEDDNLNVDEYWCPHDDAIPLNKTRRFGAEIATFASRLTARSPQQIEGVEDRPSRRVVILFDRPGISRVLPEYVVQLRSHWGDALFQYRDLWAVASRHNLYRDTTGDWPKSLVDYYPDYRSGGGRRQKPESLCATLRQACVLHQSNKSPAEVLNLITVGLIELLNCHGIRDSLNHRVNARTVWNTLSDRDPTLPLKIRRLIRDRILYGTSAWDQTAWQTFCSDLHVLIRCELPHTNAAVTFVQFVVDGSQAAEQQDMAQSRTQVAHQPKRPLFVPGSARGARGRQSRSLPHCVCAAPRLRCPPDSL
jgi:DNA helicase-2/ATP-dependent DNA helicase PcrA